MSELLILLVLICASLLVGNEFAVAAFINPSFSRLPDVPQAFAARETARPYGRIMPFWMGGNVLLSALVIFVVADSYSSQWWSYLAATILFVFIGAFSLIFPVPINNKIANWDPNDLPSDWRELRRRFDRYHQIRVILLLIALGCLVFGAVSHYRQPGFVTSSDLTPRNLIREHSLGTWPLENSSLRKSVDHGTEATRVT